MNEWTHAAIPPAINMIIKQVVDSSCPFFLIHNEYTGNKAMPNLTAPLTSKINSFASVRSEVNNVTRGNVENKRKLFTYKGAVRSSRPMFPAASHQMNKPAISRFLSASANGVTKSRERSRKNPVDSREGRFIPGLTAFAPCP